MCMNNHSFIQSNDLKTKELDLLEQIYISIESKDYNLTRSLTQNLMQLQHDLDKIEMLNTAFKSLE